jgi:hypothetical protein
MTQLEAQIFLSDLRVKEQTMAFRLYSISGKAQKQEAQQIKVPEFDVLNDVELAGNAGRLLNFTTEGYLILLPVTGDLLFKLNNAEQEHLEIGTIKIVHMRKGESLELNNPFEMDVINYLELQILTNTWAAGELPCEQPSISFELEGHDLMRLTTAALPFNLSIGRFKGRQQGVYSTTPNADRADHTATESTGSKVLCFVIAGAFEVQDRLLHMRDALYLYPIKELEFEALSENAILLIIDLFGY